MEAPLHPRRWATLAVLCLALVVIGLDNTVLNVALPTLVRSLHATQAQLQWMVDGYTIVYASLLLTAGNAGDRFGRKRALNAGLVVFGTASVASAWAPSAAALVAARAVAGVGGALIMPATLSILVNVFPPSEQQRAIGIWAGVSGLGIVIGPVVAGLLLLHFWWGAVFLINVPVVVAALVAGRSLVPESRDAGAGPLDRRGTVLGVAAVVCLLDGVIEAPVRGWAAPSVVAPLALGVSLLAAFVACERRLAHPMLDVRFFADRRFSAASGAVTLIFFAMFGTMFFVTQFLQDVLGFSALRTGLAFAPVALVMTLAAPAGAALSCRVGTKPVVVAGMAAIASALALLSRVSVGSGYSIVGVGLGLMGAGIGLGLAPATASVMASLPRNRAGIGSAVNDTSRQLGGALGVAVLGSICNAIYRSHVMTVGISEADRRTARAGVGNALGLARSLAPQTSARLATSAKGAFLHAMTTSVLVGAAVAACGAVVALVFLPARVSPERQGAREGDGPREADRRAAA